MGTRQLISSSKIVKCHVNTSDGSPTYEAGTAYEAGTVVIFQNVVYMAITDVSADDTATPDEDPDVWAIVSDSTLLIDGDIEALAQRVETIENSLIQINRDIDDLETGLQNEAEVRAVNGGGHNLAEIIISSKSNYGVTATKNSDGTLTMSGTASTATAISNVFKAHLSVGTYIASVEVLSGSHNTEKTVYFEKAVGTSGINPDILITTETYKEKTFTVSTEGDYYFQIGYQGTDEFTDFIVRYMIRSEKDLYKDFTPYAMTNRELTKDVEDLSNAQYFDFTTETSVQANTSAQPMTHTIANDGTYRVSLTSKDVDAQNGATLLINGVTVGTVRADIIENNVSRILKLKKGAVITNTNSGTARYRMDVIKLS